MPRLVNIPSRITRLSWPARILAASILVTGSYLAVPAVAQIAVRNQGYIPYSDAPINYRSQDLTDPVALLQKQIDQGKVSLTYESEQGYLKSVLNLLKVPIESQTLVFSKTSFQYPKISPRHPRALYYNDDVYVGKVHDGNAIEIVSFDPKQGAIFYLVDERKVDKPVFQRAELDCTQCHIASGTRGVPGVLLRSVFSTSNGTLTPRAPSYITDQETPLKQRWGGWYVNGSLANATMANAVAPDASSAPAATPVSITTPAQRPVPDLSPLADKTYDASAYLEPGSDQVALLVLTHQAQMHNLITLTNYQTRLALFALQKNNLGAGQNTSLEALPENTRRQIQKPADQLLHHLLFVNETALGLDAKQAIKASPFAREFAAQGIRDSKGRSLRDFDLHDRIFKYPLSYLVYNAAFDTLPEPAKGYIYHRLLLVLNGQDQSAEFAGLSAASRSSILSILLETKSDLPAEWKDYGRANHLKLAPEPASQVANN
jgi:hypothetical protein